MWLLFHKTCKSWNYQNQKTPVCLTLVAVFALICQILAKLPETTFMTEFMANFDVMSKTILELSKKYPGAPTVDLSSDFIYSELKVRALKTIGNIETSYSVFMAKAATIIESLSGFVNFGGDEFTGKAVDKIIAAIDFMNEIVGKAEMVADKVEDVSTGAGARMREVGEVSGYFYQN